MVLEVIRRRASRAYRHRRRGRVARAPAIFRRARKVGPRIRARWTRGPTNATEACPTVVPRTDTSPPPPRSRLGSTRRYHRQSSRGPPDTSTRAPDKKTKQTKINKYPDRRIIIFVLSVFYEFFFFYY